MVGEWIRYCEFLIDGQPNDPGQPVPGQFENEPTPLGPGQEVPLTPYTQVVQGYRQAALDATDRSLIPGSQRDLVREYFSRLGEPVTP